MAILSRYLFDELLGLKKKVYAINSLDATCSHNMEFIRPFLLLVWLTAASKLNLTLLFSDR